MGAAEAPRQRPEGNAPSAGRSNDGRHGLRRDVDLPDGVAVRDVEVACPVTGDPGRVAEPGGGTDPVRATELARLARERGDGPGCEDDLPDGAVAGIGDVEVARPVAGDAGRL